MRKIKKLNELFDTADQYANNEIPYLTGELKDEIERSIQKGEIEDFKGAPEMVKALRRLIFNFPFLNNSIARNVEHDSVVFVYATTENLDNAFFIKVDLAGDGLYNIGYGEVVDTVEHSDDVLAIDYKRMSDVIEKIIYPKLLEVAKFLKEKRDIDILSVDPKDANFNPMFNSKIYTFNQYVNELIEPVSLEDKIAYILTRKDDIKWKPELNKDKEEILKDMDKSELDDWYNNLKEFESRSH